MRVWVDGADVRTDLDRGLEFGDGLFETMAIVGGRIRLLERHLARLGAGCARLGIAPPPAALRTELEVAAREPGAGVLKLIVTRGRGGSGYGAAPDLPARCWVAVMPARPRPASFAEDGVALRWCETRLAVQPALAGLKHLNRLEQVLARRELQETDAAEGLMLDTDGRLVCGTMSNVFAVIDGTAVTPSLARAGVAGVMRGALLEAFAASGHRVEERDLAPSELAGASEVFVTNALIGVWPVRSLGALTWAVGPVARAAQAAVASW